MEWPETLTINAWTGEGPADSVVAPTKQSLAWVLREPPRRIAQFLAPTEADLADWTDKDVGWGLILPERAGLSKAVLASGDDAPEPIRALLKARGNAPVFRYRDTSKKRFTFLHNYRSNKSIAVDPGSPQGLAPDALPKYLLIYASPGEIPWRFQYMLNATCFAGRLDLEGEALEHYVAALLTGWQTAAARVDHPVVWAAEHDDLITRLMRDAIAHKVFEVYAKDPDLAGKATFLDGRKGEATNGALIAALAAQKPGMVVTTSHGKTGPLGDLAKMRADLGLLVDGQFATLDPAQVLASWEPDGAIWYAHACCSAGADGETHFDGLLEAGSAVDAILKGVAKVGPTVAPLPRALLGAPKPLRAFVGHVEPTFDWTLRQIDTGQHLAAGLKKALYQHIFGDENKPPKPIGFAFEEHFKRLGPLSLNFDEAKRQFDEHRDAESRRQMLNFRLSYLDVQSTVILGDPTAILPSL